MHRNKKTDIEFIEYLLAPESAQNMCNQAIKIVKLQKLIVFTKFSKTDHMYIG